MKILMITYRFPPYNSSGAVRCGKMSKYLSELGHDVRVISCKDQPLPKTLALELPQEKVMYTTWWNINAPVEKLLGGRKKIARSGVYSVLNKPGIKSKVLKFFGKLYKNVLHMPDAQIGWKWAAVRKGEEIIKEWSPDVIYASAHPITSFIVANELSNKSGVPWIGELRDLWVDSPYYTNPIWKKWIEEKWERKIFSKASGLISITDHSVKLLCEKYSCPVEVILNGFDESDYNQGVQEMPLPRSFIKGGINILYAGMIYPGKRDPEPLLKAISLLSNDLRKHVKVHFYGTQLSIVNQVSEDLKITSNVTVNAPIPYSEILKMQQQADILLLLMWNNPLEVGTFTGKFFEYIGAKRPILCIGGHESPPAKVITERSLGTVLFEPIKIASYLKDLITDKNDKGFIESIPQGGEQGFSRKEQAEKLSLFLKKVVKPPNDIDY